MQKNKISYARIKLANRRFKKWKENPEQMELIRQRAIEIARKRRYERLDNLKNLIKSWPEQLTTDEFRSRIELIEYKTKNGKLMNKLSLVNRIRSKGLVVYDTGLGLWKNMTKLT